MRRQQIAPLCESQGHSFDDDSDGELKCIYCGRQPVGYMAQCYSCFAMFGLTEAREMYDHYTSCMGREGETDFALYKIVPVIETKITSGAALPASSWTGRRHRGRGARRLSHAATPTS